MIDVDGMVGRLGQLVQDAHTAACLGCCSLAPVMMVDGVVYGRLDESSVRDILESFD